ncbi:Bacteriophage head to tail connecting protein [Prosthecobacter debontii]|uniref:Bacteriophage head to tail connecting protein n=1 Tax=Prosthecobacter debontii TaxID=48467 RepID=A0A1T4XIA5_9BACT|nr:portal protein [Prosthecobacter debontii]SKA88848.1 Bacteriophage head to tail connecting protein [Prosthecobacter debontii]
MTGEQPELGKKLLERYEALKALRAPWETLWDEIAKYIMPRRSPGLNGNVSSPSTSSNDVLFDITAVQSNMTLANGQLAWMSPMETPWFAFEPRASDDEAKRWLAKSTSAAREELANSNFYTAVHEFYLDRGGFGTACLYVEPGKKKTLNAQVWPVGSFVLDEDDEGTVDTVMRCFKLTARQAIQKFGEDKVSKKVRELAEKGGAKAHERHEYIHAIYPRADAERDKAKIDDKNMPIASVYFEKDGYHVCKVSGYEEMPVFVSRYLEWGSATGWLYGWAPGFSALPEARQLNFLQQMMDALAEKMAFPPVLAPEELEGEIDGNAMGVTYFSKDLVSHLPKEWMTQGRYDIGLQRIQERQRAIKEAFHVDLFQMFAQLTKQMTAREVAERSQEKLIQFSPTFSRLTTELFNPLLERIFGIILRGGQLGTPPQSLLIPVNETQAFISPPKVRYSSRIALALASLPSIGYARTVERLTALVQVAPHVLDNFDLDRAERQAALADGMDADCLVPEADVKKTRQERADQAAQQQQMMQAAAAADAAAKVGKIPSDSPVGKQLEQVMTVA